MADFFVDSFDTGWADLPTIPTFLPGTDSLADSFDVGWSDAPPPVLEETPEGRSFFIYRSCDLSATGTREALRRNDDIFNRGVALIESPTGLPDEEDGASDNPTIDIIDAEWGPPVPGEGALPPGTYVYDAVPVDTCTGRTGTPIPLPSLTIRQLGEVATLRVALGTPPEECDALILRRDREIVGPVFDDLTNIDPKTVVITQPNPFGNYDFGTDRNFRRLGFDTGDPNDFDSPTADPVAGRRPGPGADLIGGDAILYNNFTVKVDLVNPWPPRSPVDTGQGQEIRFEPPIPAELISPPGAYDSANRSGFYDGFITYANIVEAYSGGLVSMPGTTQYSPKWPPGTDISWMGPLMSFVKIPPTTFGILPYMDDLQAGDIIAIGSKTGLVVYVERNPLAFPNSTLRTPMFGTVLYIPFGILPIPPLPFGQYWVVYRSELTPTFFFYYTLGEFFKSNVTPSLGTISDFNAFELNLLRGRETRVGAEDFLYPEGGSQNTDYDPADIPNERNATKAFRVVTFDVVEDPPGSGRYRPGFLPRGQMLIYDLQIVTVQFVNEVLPPTGLLPGEYEVEVTPLNGKLFDFGAGEVPAQEILPSIPVIAPDGVNVERPVTPIGPAVTIPSFLSPFLKPALIAPFGQYERLTRLANIETVDSTVEFPETGESRSGDTDGSEAAEELNDVFTQANYPGGLEGLLDRVRGPQANQAQDVFVKTLGTLTRAGNRLIGCNSPIVALGTGSIIDLGSLRTTWEQLCSESSKLEEMAELLQTDGFAIARLESREVQIPAALCPPDQPDAREVRLFCLGFATPQQKLRSGELARIYFAPDSRFESNQATALTGYGLTQVEAEDALTLNTVDRVISVNEFTDTYLGQIVDFTGISEVSQELDDILDDTRIETVNTGTLNRPQIQEIIRRRGNAGITFRPPGTDETDNNPAADDPIEDFALPAHNLAGLAFQLQLSFDVCDYDAAIASIPDPELRNRLASFFAVVENVLTNMTDVGRAVVDFLDNSGFSEAADAIAGIIAASSSDPTLSCFGSAASAALGFPGIPTFSAVDGFFADFARGFQQRFDLSQLLGQALASVLCSIIGSLAEVISFFDAESGAIANQATQQALQCLPTEEQLAELGLTFPSIEAQIAVECSLEQMNILLDIVNALIAEANEIIDFGNELNTGFVSRTVEVRNRACSSGEGLTALVGGLRAFVGLG